MTYTITGSMDQVYVGGGTKKQKHMISKQSIRKGIIVKFDGVEVDKSTIIQTSESWTENQEILFKKFILFAKSSAAIPKAFVKDIVVSNA